MFIKLDTSRGHPDVIHVVQNKYSLMSAVCYDNFQSIFNLVQGLITGEISIYFIRGKYTAVYYLYPSFLLLIQSQEFCKKILFELN